MGRQNVEKLSFNRGVISPLALGRTDVKRVALSAEVQINFMPRVLGPMSLRPGLKFIGGTHNQQPARYLPFVFAVDDTALIELTPFAMRVLVNDIEVTRPANGGSQLVNAGFTTDLSSWNDSDQGTFTESLWVAPGYMSLRGDGTLGSIRTQAVTPTVLAEHALRVVVVQGIVMLRIGPTSAGEYIYDTYLGVGTHSIAYTPTSLAAYNVTLSNRDDTATLIDSVTIESPGSMILPTPWAEADLNNIRYVQSGDIIFVACKGVKPMKIERRGKTSWSVVDFLSDDGPFMVENLTPITLASTSITGETTLNASAVIFTPGNVGSLFQLRSIGQVRDKVLSAANVFTDPIVVNGLTINRNLHIFTTGTWVATLTLQRSVGAPGAWVDVTNYTTNQNVDYNDGLDNQIIYYRLGIKTGNFTSGAALATLSTGYGSITGVIRVTRYVAPNQVIGIILSDIGSLAPTADWSESYWSPRRGFPSAVAIHEGRLWWAGKDRLWGSASDAYYSYGELPEGDAGSISRSIGIGPVDTINWLVSAEGLVMGGFGSEFVCRSSSLDEPITPTNFKIKRGTTIGSYPVDPFIVDASVIFVDRTQGRLYELTSETFSGNYAIKELTALVPEIGRPGIVRTAVQRKIDTRLHCVRTDGVVSMMIFDKLEEVNCWLEINTKGVIEDVVVLPSSGSEEDIVYYLVRRTVQGAQQRYLERWALTSECEGGMVNKQADSYVHQTAATPTQLIFGLSHLEGENVVVWGDGRDLGTFPVTFGSVTLPIAVTDAVVGLRYTADFVSTKMAYAAQSGSALTQEKRIDHLALILRHTHHQGLIAGDSLLTMDPLPLVEEGSVTPADTVWYAYDESSFEVNGTYNTDERLCMRAIAPRPCTVLAAVVTMSTYEKL